MSKYVNKTQATKDSVDQFIASIEDQQKQQDSKILLELLTKFTGEKAVLCGSIVGFGSYHYSSKASQGDWPRIGFSPRKAALTIYIIPGYEELKDKLARLGKHKLGKSCLYINKLADVDITVLTEIMQFGIDYMDQKYQKTRQNKLE